MWCRNPAPRCSPQSARWASADVDCAGGAACTAIAGSRGLDQPKFRYGTGGGVGATSESPNAPVGTTVPLLRDPANVGVFSNTLNVPPELVRSKLPVPPAVLKSGAV